MKLTSIKRNFLLFGLLLGFLCLMTPTLQAQNEATPTKKMTITLTTVDKDGEKSVKAIVLTGDDVDEGHVQQIVEDNLTGDEVSVEVDVDISIESGAEMDGDEMEITIDLEKETIGENEVNINEQTRTIILEDGQFPEDIEINEDMKITIDGDKIYLNGEEIQDGDQNGQIRILKMDTENMDMEGDKEIRIVTKTIESTQQSCNSQKNKGAFLGVFYEGNADGVEVTEVIENSAAQKAGLKAGDIINTINGKAVTSENEFVKTIASHKIGDKISITFVRESNSRAMDITLGERPQNQNWTNYIFEPDFDWKDLEGKEWKPMTKEELEALGNTKKKCDPSNCTPEQIAKCCPELLGNSSKCDPRSCPPWMCEDKAQMGVYIEDTEDGNGVLLTDVSEGKGSERAGLLANDIVYKIDKTTLTTADDLIATIATYKPGDVIKVKYLRDGKKQKTNVTLGGKQVRKAEYQKGNCCAPGTKTTIDKQTIIIKRNKNEEGEIIETPSFNVPNNTLEFTTLNLFPNPTNGELNIQFTTPEKAATAVTVLDATGKEIYRDEMANYNGNYSKKIDLTNNANGIYFLRIQQGEKIYTEQIVIAKAK